MVDRVSEEATWDDLIREIYVCQMIEQGFGR